MSTQIMHIPTSISKEYFLGSYQYFINNIIRHARLQKKSDEIFGKAKDIFDNNEKKHMEEFESARAMTFQETAYLLEK